MAQLPFICYITTNNHIPTSMPKKKESTTPEQSIVPTELVEERILLIRGLRVMIDADLASIYGVTTKRLNEQVKRNKARFPADFMFNLTEEEKAEVIANCDHLKNLKFSPVSPNAFTEHGAVMLASVLNSPIAVEASIQVVRAFVRMRSILFAHKELAKKLEELEKKHDTQAHKTEAQYKAVLELIRKVIKGQTPAQQAKRKIGFKTDDEK